MKKIILLLIIAPFIISAQNDVKKSEEKNVISSKKSQNNAQELLESYRQRVIKGESMSTLAELYSEDPGSAKDGGKYNNIVRGLMVPEFDAIAFKLKPNEISEVFETEYGFHFIKLISKNGESLNLQHILITKK